MSINIVHDDALESSQVTPPLTQWMSVEIVLSQQRNRVKTIRQKRTYLAIKRTAFPLSCEALSITSWSFIISALSGRFHAMFDHRHFETTASQLDWRKMFRFEICVLSNYCHLVALARFLDFLICTTWPPQKTDQVWSCTLQSLKRERKGMSIHGFHFVNYKLWQRVKDPFKCYQNHFNSKRIPSFNWW